MFRLVAAGLASRQHSRAIVAAAAAARVSSSSTTAEPKVPYSRLGVGVPKETWSGEKRWTTNYNNNNNNNTVIIIYMIL